MGVVFAYTYMSRHYCTKPNQTKWLLIYLWRLQLLQLQASAVSSVLSVVGKIPSTAYTSYFPVFCHRLLGVVMVVVMVVMALWVTMLHRIIIRAVDHFRQNSASHVSRTSLRVWSPPKKEEELHIHLRRLLLVWTGRQRKYLLLVMMQLQTWTRTCSSPLDITSSKRTHP